MKSDKSYWQGVAACFLVVAIAFAGAGFFLSKSRQTNQQSTPETERVTEVIPEPERRPNSPAPPKSEVDEAVNWSLSVHRVDKYEPNSRKNWFESYTIANTYTETRDGHIEFVYDYKAQVPAAAGLWEGDGSKPIAWQTPKGRYNLARDDTPSGDIKIITIEGSVTLMKKGEAWYCKDTKR
jgi:hypothetical protein